MGPSLSMREAASTVSRTQPHDNASFLVTTRCGNQCEHDTVGATHSPHQFNNGETPSSLRGPCPRRCPGRCTGRGYTNLSTGSASLLKGSKGFTFRELSLQIKGKPTTLNSVAQGCCQHGHQMPAVHPAKAQRFSARKVVTKISPFPGVTPLGAVSCHFFLQQLKRSTRGRNLESFNVTLLTLSRPAAEGRRSAAFILRVRHKSLRPAVSVT